ncbi:hypothetical protein [Citricoccus sp. GCM10030269]|uniref:ParB family protein n=1 Tax=Citricoccus sp. GCM10030269 TaxID=3273388 RepID=UPI00360B7767
MTRPTARKSSLAGTNPIAPAHAGPPPATPTVQTEGPAVSAATTADSGRRSAGKKYPHKVSFYQDPQDTARVRGAILYTMTTEGNRNLWQFVNRAVMAEVERLEAKYNDGRPFPSVGAREIPQGGAAAAREEHQ